LKVKVMGIRSMVRVSVKVSVECRLY